MTTIKTYYERKGREEERKEGTIKQAKDKEIKNHICL